ncbi:gamma-tocopherol methyltransferase [Chloropicon primus]|uniref:Gamma-tocopherol methyltransferase n=1 Tax=Chloropicon primus TaxID=1764295 RepID=A0A5B8MSN8_9CHLO|nr:gamma-tocopherol methyltransferase [Chloropicon primus]UPR02068.1 gamma-tocopherol methyltransferase [Chloropicon primus]|eukprot:QDZ22844.1 gamma-tocopherol methyltransferase [Chloropicon primus]
MEERDQKTLKKGIAKFYDESSTLWEQIWGEHMHHGYYESTAKLSIEEHREAQVLMIDKVLEWAGAGLGKEGKVLDVGCGVGGSTRHIVAKYGCGYGCGITLSPYQAKRAGKITAECDDLPEDSVVEFKVEDALNQPFEDESFDLVWSMESGEHMPDKEKFVNELYRVLKPGGRVIVVTWCHRVLGQEEQSLSAYERLLLALINRAYFLPAWVSIAEYDDLATQAGFEGIKIDDWSPKVAPFWTAVLKTALTLNGLRGLLKAGPKTMRGAAVMPLMRLGFASGTIKFNLMTAVKPLK